MADTFRPWSLRVRAAAAAGGDRTVLMLRVRKKYSIYHVDRAAAAAAEGTGVETI